MTLRDDLIAAKALIDTPEKWGKGVTPGCMCVMAAVERISPFHFQAHRWREMEAALWRALPRNRRDRLGHAVVLFNDDPTTTHADVMALFDRAIAACGDAS